MLTFTFCSRAASAPSSIVEGNLNGAAEVTPRKPSGAIAKEAKGKGRAIPFDPFEGESEE
jgi:hypothetical protein